MKLIVDVEAFEKYLDLYIDQYEIPGAMEALRKASENDKEEDNKCLISYITYFVKQVYRSLRF